METLQEQTAEPSLQWVRGLLNRLPYPAVLLHESRTECNQSMSDAMGLDCESDGDSRKTSNPIEEFFDGETLEEFRRSAADAIPSAREVTCRQPDGTKVHLLAASISLTLSDKTDAVLIICNDLTEQRHMEKSLGEIASFAEMNPGPVLRLNREGVIELVNPAACSLFVGTKLIGKQWQSVCPDVTDELWEEILSGSATISVEASVEEQSFVFTHRCDPSGAFVFVYGNDVTQQRRMERDLRQAEKMATLGTLAAGVAHELNNPASAAVRASHQLQETFRYFLEVQNRMPEIAASPQVMSALFSLLKQSEGKPFHAARLEPLVRADREAAFDEWFSAHAIDDPTGMAMTLVDMGLTPAQLESLKSLIPMPHLETAIQWLAHSVSISSLLHEVGQSSMRISEIVGALKSYSFLGQAPIQRIDIHEGIDNTLIILRGKLERGVTVRREYGNDVPPITAFGSELNQVWTNLLDNAIDAMDGHGMITVRTKRNGDHIAVEIEDDGPGIPAEIQACIFDPFFTTKAPGKGSGLGLATCFSIVSKKHHGEMVLTSRPGMTRFTVKLPIEFETKTLPEERTTHHA